VRASHRAAAPRDGTAGFSPAQVRLAVQDGAKRLLRPAVERTVWREAHAAADTAALSEFAVNLRALLMQRPLSDVTVLGLDPGFTSGCKLAVCSAVGTVLATDTLHPFRARTGGGHAGSASGQGGGEAEAKRRLCALIEQYQVMKRFRFRAFRHGSSPPSPSW
jgi:hypothetical protein